MTKTKASPSPFPPVAARKLAKSIEIDTDLLVVEHSTPLPRLRSSKSTKYGPVFGKLKPGSCIRCEPKETSPISNVLRKAMEQGKYPAIKGCKVITRMRCDDGHGRVWVVKEDAK
jgi:hypothetical protein